jgi:hypothetical protein
MVFGVKCLNAKNGIHEIFVYNTKEEAERAYHVLANDDNYISQIGFTAYADKVQTDVYGTALSVIERVEEKQFATPVMVDVTFSIGENAQEMYTDDITIINDRSATIHS